MTSLELLGRVVGVLDDLGIPHMLVGAFSANAYGIARATKDADFVVACEPRDISRIAAALGDDMVLDPQMRFETITNSTRHVVSHEPTGFDVEFFLLTDDPHDQERFRRRRQGMVSDVSRPVWVPSAEDVVIQKLRWHRDKDLMDVRNVIAVRQAALDWAYIHRWAAAHGTSDLLGQILAELRELDVS